MKLTTPLPAPVQPMTLAEVAEFLRMSRRTVRRWVDEGRLKACRTHPGRGGRILIDRRDALAVVGFTEAASA